MPSAKTAQFANTAGYALYVHEGVVLRSGTRLPPRPWMYDTVAGEHGFGADELIVSDIFVDAYKKTDSLSKAFRATAQAANKEIKAAFNYRWGWPRPTMRRSGEVAGVKRNIVDLGNLKRAQQPVRFLP